MKVKLFICLVLFCGLSFSLSGGAIIYEVEKARSATSKTVIKCSPDGENGGMTPLKALSMLKDGMTLLLLPGVYSDEIEIFNDKVIITSDAKEKCNVTVKVSGRDCIVKDIYLSNLSSKRDIVVVDSLILSFSCGAWSSNKSEKVDVYIYNTGLTRLTSSSSNNTIVEMKNCVVNGSVDCNSNMRLIISESVLTSGALLFRFSNYDNKKGKITIKDSLLSARGGLGKIVYSGLSRKKNRRMRATTLKELKRLWNITLSGKNIVAQPKFISGSRFFQQDSSPGEGRGLIPEEHPLKPEKRKRVVEIATPDTDEKKVSDPTEGQDRRRPKKKPRRPKPPPEEELGGFPKPPE